MKKCLLISLFLLCFQLIYAQDELNFQGKIAPVDSSNVFITEGYYTWGASVVKGDDNRFYMFYSRWPHGERKLDDDSLNYIFNGFSGWMKYSEIACAVSDKLGGPYKYVKTVLKSNDGVGTWDQYSKHNPHVRKFGGYYYLYYSGNSFDPSFKIKGNPNPGNELAQWYRYNATQAVGVVKAKTIKDLLSGNFEKPIEPVMKADNVKTFEVANNPSVTQGPDGKYYMMYKSRIPGGGMTFWMAKSDEPDGEFKTVSNVISDKDLSSEDPSMWYDKKRKRFYAVAKYYAHSLKYAPEFGSLILIESKNGTDWALSKNSLVSLKEVNFKDGRKVKLDRLERPFVYTDKNGKPLALFAAASIYPLERNEIEVVDEEHNTFNVSFPIKIN